MAESSYMVTIIRQTFDGRDSWVAFDDDGNWRTHGLYKPELSGKELALYLFHPEEVLEVSTGPNGETVVKIREW